MLLNATCHDLVMKVTYEQLAQLPWHHDCEWGGTIILLHLGCVPEQVAVLIRWIGVAPFSGISSVC